MTAPMTVKIIGAPIACADGTKDAWREVASWTKSQLQARFGNRVQVNYFDLFDPQCPTLPENAQLPVVFINDALISSGEKISIPVIRKHIETQIGSQTSI